MKQSTTTFFCLSAVILFTGLLVPVEAVAADNAQIDVMLVKAGNGEGGVDPALRPYAANLERLFRFQRYELVSRKPLRIEVPGEGVVSLPGGQRLSVSAAASSGSGIKADIDWIRGSQRLLHTRIQLRPGSPAVLGGPRSEDATWLLILQLK